MNRLEFAASVIGDVLSWPVAVFAIALLLRTQLRDLIKRIRRGRFFGQDVEFGDDLERAEEVTAVAVAQVRSSARLSPSSDSETADVNDRAQSNPSGVIIDSWERLADAVNELSTVHGFKTRNPYAVTEIATHLAKDGVVNTAFVESTAYLQGLRNRVAHGRHDPLPGEAAGYAEMARELTRAAEALKAAQGHVGKQSPGAS